MQVECAGDLGTTGFKIARSDPDAQGFVIMAS